MAARPQHFQPGHRESVGRRERRLTRGDLAPYRSRYIAGESLAQLAPEVQAEFGIDTEASALRSLQGRAYGDQWAWHKEQHQLRIADEVLARVGQDRVQGFLDHLSTDGDFLLQAGLESLTRLQPGTVTEALDMIRTGVQLGLRGRNLPDRLNLAGAVPLLLATDPAAMQAAQVLPAGTYEALAESCDAEFAALPPGPAAP